MDKLKEKLHIGSRRKSQPENEAHQGVGTIEENRESIDSELAAMTPAERVAYLKEFDESDKHGTPKKGGLIEKLIARGNKRTEEQLAREAEEKKHVQGSVGPGAGAGATSAAGPTIG